MKKFNEPVIEVVEFAKCDVATGVSNPGPGIDTLPPVIE